MPIPDPHAATTDENDGTVSSLAAFIRTVLEAFGTAISPSIIATLADLAEAGTCPPQSWLALGDELATRHHHDLAIAAYQRAVDGDPQLTLAYFHAGLCHAALSRDEQAAGCWWRALQIDPALAEVENNLAVILARMGRRDEAILHYQKAVSLRPADADALHNLGNALSACQRHHEAIAVYAQAFRADPRRSQAYFFAGVSHAALGQNEEAIAAWQQALSIDPALAEAENNTAVVLLKMGRRDDAIRHYENAIALRPGYWDALNNLGNALAGANRHEEAVRYLLMALAASPDNPTVHANLGQALKEMGRLAEARDVFAAGLSRCPDNAHLYLVSSEVMRYAPDSPQIPAMEALLAEGDSRTDLERVDLHFAMAKALEDIGEAERAFFHMREGGIIKRRQFHYDEAVVLATLDRVQTVFSAEFIQARQGHGHPSALPIFIVGSPRSGSTLVEQILSSHPMVAIAGEINALDQALGRVGVYRSFPQSMAGVEDRVWGDIGAAYLTEIAGLAANHQRVTDKMLTNSHFVGLIHLALPQARIIHTVRDPVDTCLSCFSKLFVDVPYSYDLGELGRHYHHYRLLMEHWHRVLPDHVMIDVQYEDVVADLEGQARRIIAHCGLPWDDACLSFHLAKQPVRTASAAQVRRPIYHSSVGRWRPDEATLAPLLRGLAGLPD